MKKGLKLSFAGLALGTLGTNGGVVRGATADSRIEDTRIGSQPGDGKFADLTCQRAAIQQVTRDVVEPQTLSALRGLPDCCCRHDVLLTRTSAPPGC